ncbi:MAG: ImmA/IrrE family metallo-endopeptidase [Polyangiaceae bacterium]|nr:ImmA/IrrE family metallo-endopeptidase [Polyangiaceae bacterium]
MTPTIVAECEAIAVAAYVSRGLDPERPLPPGILCEKLFGTRPKRMAGLSREGRMGIVRGEVWIYVRAGTNAARERFVLGHEMAHGLLGEHHSDANIALERRCDLLGSCLLVPRPAFELAFRRWGYAVYDLAHALSITQASAMLRLGEVTGRSVRLLGPRERFRGEPFDWPDVRKCLRGGCRSIAHPIKLVDERKWGMIAS